ncbi:helix-turn-helix transcriptional regulator [Candidatus Woesearchaeota archaeon]|nr:helix-turn-helix transcriptional regulator [Candidatus Woesearchaeota archaeon]
MKISLEKVRKPRELGPNEEIAWFTQTLGLESKRDKQKIVFKIFSELVKEIKIGNGLSSEELAQRLKLSRTTIIHHLNKLIDSGLIIKHSSKYFLRENSLTEVLKEIRKDLDRIFLDLESTAKDIDEGLGLK